MQVTNPNNVNIYNLSAGKSLPEWLSDRKKRSLQKNDPELQKRIELIQDFEMPTVSNSVQVSKDKQYILATGVYKPRLRCYDVNELSLKFERCMDSEPIKFSILSDDYSKLLFLQNDRYVEFHAQHGRWYRTRIPKYGRDFAFHEPSCDVYFVGVSPEIFRLNLEQGRFMNSLKTDATEIFCCEFNPLHHLFTCGTREGHIECWDPRVRNRVGKLDCALSNFTEDSQVQGIPAITTLKYKDGLHFAAGTTTGQILLYDLRSSKPLLVKDHQYELPIKNIAFHTGQDLVLSLDSRILKIWDEKTGKPFTSIEPGVDLNDLCVVPDTGLLFMTNEAPKILTYYIPSLGPAPRWCSFLDSLTEELEENPTPTVYDDYKFVSRTELEGLGLAHLIGTSLLRAYMHGYFMDVRLYHKAKALLEPFAYEEYRKAQIRDKIEEARANRVKIKKLPKVNRLLAEKLIDQEEGDLEKKKGKKNLPNLLKDDRFSRMFKDANFQVDAESEEYKLLNPLVSKLDKNKLKKQRQALEQFDEVEEEQEGRPSEDESSSDDEHTWTAEVKKQHRLLRQEERFKNRAEERESHLKPKFFELKEGQELMGPAEKADKKHKKVQRKSLGDRVKDTEDTAVIRKSGSEIGNMEMTYDLKKSRKEKQKRQLAMEHHGERRKLRRSAADLVQNKPQSKFWMGRKVQR